MMPEARMDEKKMRINAAILYRAGGATKKSTKLETEF
jgi:hypothetical protein